MEMNRPDPEVWEPGHPQFEKQTKIGWTMIVIMLLGVAAVIVTGLYQLVTHFIK